MKKLIFKISGMMMAGLLSVCVLAGCDAGLRIVKSELGSPPDKKEYDQYVDHTLDFSGGTYLTYLQQGDVMEDNISEGYALSESEKVDFNTPGTYSVLNGEFEVEVVPIDECTWLDEQTRASYKADAAVDRTQDTALVKALIEPYADKTIQEGIEKRISEGDTVAKSGFDYALIDFYEDTVLVRIHTNVSGISQSGHSYAWGPMLTFEGQKSDGTWKIVSVT